MILACHLDVDDTELVVTDELEVTEHMPFRP